MQPAPPHIMIAVPVGTKDLKSEVKLPDCGIEGCTCPNHGKYMSTTTRGNLLVPLRWSLGIPNLVIPLNTTVGYLVQGGMLSADARNMMTKRALEAGSKYIFYWDDDVIIPPLSLYWMHTLLETNPDIGLVTGVYTTREDPPEPLIYQEHGKGAWWNFSINPEDSPQDIFGCGGGCIMARLEDIRKMEEPYWFDEQVIHDDTGKHQTMWGHDIRFVKNFREQTGKRTVVKGSILCSHFDAEKNKLYELPKDSPPFKALGKSGHQTHELVEIEELTELMLDRALQETNGEQRLFLTKKKDHTQEAMRDVLGSRFDSVDFCSVDEHWLAICEGLRNGKNGYPDRKGECRDTPRTDSGGGDKARHHGIQSGGKGEGSSFTGYCRTAPR